MNDPKKMPKFVRLKKFHLGLISYDKFEVDLTWVFTNLEEFIGILDGL